MSLYSSKNFPNSIFVDRLRTPLASIGAMILMVLCVLTSASAQQITGTLVGTVQDSQNAVVPGASVTATNVETGISHGVTTNGAGEYRIDYLPVGAYSIVVTSKGFQKFVQQNVTLTLDQTQRVDATLTIGAEDQTITVTAAPPLVNTSTSEIGRTVMADEITQLPLPNRNVYTQLSLTAGVLSSSASGAGGANYNSVIGLPSTQVVIGGGFDGGVGTVSFYLDGGINQTSIRNYGNPAPNPDALPGVPGGNQQLFGGVRTLRIGCSVAGDSLRHEQSAWVWRLSSCAIRF